MPECETCGEHDFELLDGLYYCTQCHTQTQELKEEEFETEDAPNFMLEIKTPKVKHKKAEKGRDKGRPWHTHEAWTIILRKQVDALIQLGADPMLKDVVLRIWVRYLSTCGVAFTASSDVQPHPESVCRDRDRCPPSVSNPDVKDMNISKIVRKGLSGMTTVLKAKEKKEKKILQEALKDEKFYKGDNPFSDDDSDTEDMSPANNDYKPSDKEMSSDDDVEEKQLKRHLFKSRPVVKHYRHVECMTPTTTLALCHLGLLHLHPLIAPMDLLRWSKAGKFPYRHQMLSSLPEDMKFCFSDLRTFTAYNVTVDNIRHRASLLCKFLKLESCFKPVPLDMMCSRYIIEMNLPGEFHYLTRVLLSKIPHPLRAIKRIYLTKQDQTCQFVETEVLSMACIIVVLKLLCLLNDKTEKKITLCAKKIQSMFRVEQNLFVFEDWLHYMEHSRHTSQLDLFTAHIEDLCSMRDTEKIFQDFSEKHEESSSYASRRQSKKKKAKAQTEETRENIQRPFLALLDKYNSQARHRAEENRNMVKDEEPEDEAFGPMENSLIAMLEKHPVSVKQEVKEELQGRTTPQLTVVPTGDKIRQSTVTYILDKSYLIELDPRLRSPYTEDESTDDTSDSCSESKFDNLSQSLFSQMSEDGCSPSFNFLGQQRQKSSGTMEERVEEVKQPELDDVMKLQEQLESLTSRKKYCLTCHEDDWPRSYARTLSVCSDIIGCSNKQLNWHVWLIEAFCVVGDDPVISRLKNVYLNRYFDVDEKPSSH